MGLRERLDEWWNGKKKVVEGRLIEGTFSTILPHVVQEPPHKAAIFIKRCVNATSSSWKLIYRLSIVLVVITGVISNIDKIQEFLRPFFIARPAKSVATDPSEDNADKPSSGSPKKVQHVQSPSTAEAAKSIQYGDTKGGGK